MSFNILIQINYSEKNKMSKSITNVTSLTGTLKNNTSIVNPVILIEADMNSIVSCNYMTIPVFKRSYFITDMISIRNKLVEIHAHCDVLSSFSDAIKSNSGIVYRQENKWNLYLNDGSFKIYQNPNVLTKAFPSGFSSQEFVLAVAGSNTANNLKVGKQNVKN